MNFGSPKGGRNSDLKKVAGKFPNLLSRFCFSKKKNGDFPASHVWEFGGVVFLGDKKVPEFEGW